MTRPSNPCPVFFQPFRNIAQCIADGFDVFAGPEVEGSGTLKPAELAAAQKVWIDAVGAAGAWVILKNPTAPVPAHCYAFMLSADEPDGHVPQIPPAALKAEYDRLRALDPNMPIVLSLDGAKVTSALKPGNAQSNFELYRQYLDLCDIATVDPYPMNRNASRYKTSWPADAITRLKTLVPGKEVWAWLEVNDQQLNPPNPPDVNREPSPAEIKEQWDKARAAGAKATGFFLTCVKIGWPIGYRPAKNRGGHSVQAQYDMMRTLNLSVKTAAPIPPPVVVPPPPPPPPVHPGNNILTSADLQKRIDALPAGDGGRNPHVVLPPYGGMVAFDGEVDCTESIRLPAGVTLIGSGQKSAVLWDRRTGAIDAPLIVLIPSQFGYCNNVTVAGLGLHSQGDGIGGNPKDSSILCSQFVDLDLSCQGTGLKLGYVQDSLVENVFGTQKGPAPLVDLYGNQNVLRRLNTSGGGAPAPLAEIVIRGARNVLDGWNVENVRDPFTALYVSGWGNELRQSWVETPAMASKEGVQVFLENAPGTVFSWLFLHQQMKLKARNSPGIQLEALACCGLAPESVEEVLDLDAASSIDVGAAFTAKPGLSAAAKASDQIRVGRFCQSDGF